MQSSKRKSGRKDGTKDGAAASGTGRAPGCCAGLRELLSPRLFKALGDPNRVALLARLADCRGGCTVSEAAACCNVDLSVVSRHLALLRDAGILEAQRRGKQVFYSVRATALADTLRTLADLLSGCVAGACDAERKEHEVGK